MQTPFEIKIIEQGWLGNEPAQFDLCSHGKIYLTIADQVILDGSDNYGISESALALLRTLDHDHGPDNHLAEKMIFHGCGNVLMMGCVIGLDWTVRHVGQEVILSDIVRWDWPDESRPTRFEGLSVRMIKSDFVAAVLPFALAVKNFFEGADKVFFNDDDRQAYTQFWTEFDTRLNFHLKNKPQGN
jgi:hypothetical protein